MKNEDVISKVRRTQNNFRQNFHHFLRTSFCLRANGPSQETFQALLGHPLRKRRKLVFEEPYAVQPAHWKRLQELCGVLIGCP